MKKQNICVTPSESNTILQMKIKDVFLLKVETSILYPKQGGVLDCLWGNS